MRPNNEISPQDCVMSLLGYTSYVNALINSRFDDYYRNNESTYEVAIKNAPLLLFDSYISLQRNRDEANTCVNDWGTNPKVWVYNEADVSINADEEQRALGKIDSYKTFETILSNNNLLGALYKKAEESINAENVRELISGYEYLELKLEELDKTNLTSIRDIEWRRMLRKYYFDFLTVIHNVPKPKNEIVMSKADAIFLVDILLQHANVTSCNSKEKNALIAAIVKSTSGSVQNAIQRNGGNLSDANSNKQCLNIIGKKFADEKLTEQLLELYRKSNYPQE